MSELKAGDVVYHKANNRQGVVVRLFQSTPYAGPPSPLTPHGPTASAPMAMVDFGEALSLAVAVSSLSLVESVDVLARLAALEQRVGELEEREAEREQQPDRFGFNQQ